jgi:hypothetical protein
MRTRHALKRPPARAHWQDEVSSLPAPRAARAGIGAGLGARAWRDLVVVEGRGEQKASLSLAENFLSSLSPPQSPFESPERHRERVARRLAPAPGAPAAAEPRA